MERFDTESVRLIARQVRRLDLELARVRRQLTAFHCELPDDWALIAKSPAGGIDAIDGDTPGSADCTVYKVDSDGDLASCGYDVTVYNMAGAVSGEVYIQIKRESTTHKWFVDTENCEEGT